MKHLLYSTQSQLAFRIGQRYFQKRHYVYCSVEFATRNPSSSSPQDLYNLYRLIAERGDRGNPKLLSQKNTLKAVANLRLAEGKLTQEEYDDMVWEIEHAETREFAPVLLLILRDAVQSKIRSVPVSQRASSSSDEFIIEELEEDEFEYIDTDMKISSGL